MLVEMTLCRGKINDIRKKNFWGIVLNRRMGVGCKVQVRAEEE